MPALLEDDVEYFTHVVEAYNESVKKKQGSSCYCQWKRGPW